MPYNPEIEELVHNVGINKLSTAFDGIKTQEELHDLNIYSQLSGDDLDEAETDLLARVLTFNGEDDLDTMSISHVNATPDFYAGTGTPISSSIGAGLDGNKVFTPDPVLSYWKTHDVLAKAKKLLVQTNIVAGNLPSHDAIIYLTQAFKNSANSATSSQRAQVSFGASSGDGDGTHGVVASGPSYAGNVGDIGTFFAEIDFDPEITNENEIGGGNPFDTHFYYIIGLQINAGAATKAYKFSVQVQYD